MAKPTSIAAAAAVGFLKVPGMVEPTQAGTKSIADAARAGMLKVPTAGEKKGDLNNLLERIPGVYTPMWKGRGCSSEPFVSTPKRY